MLRTTLGANIALRVEADADLPPVLADRGQLDAVLVNLANNARDAMPHGGVLTLTAELLPPTAPDAPPGLKPGGYVRLSVVDEGEGMSPAVLARVTEPFFTTKPKGEGTGLGLAMARGFAEQSGGALAIRSEVGRGTMVSLWLPASAPPATAASAIAAAAGIFANPAAVRPPAAVLVVEDNPDVREIIVAVLTDRGFAVTEAQDGQAALTLLDDGLRPDALVTDLAMPGGLDGLALAEAVRRRLRHLPVVLVTGHAGTAGAERLGAIERDGPFALIRKPAPPDVLVERLSRVLGSAAPKAHAA